MRWQKQRKDVATKHVCFLLLFFSFPIIYLEKNEISSPSTSISDIIKVSWKCTNLSAPYTDVNFSPAGKHWDAIRKMTACCLVIPRICLTVGLRRRRWNRIVKWLLLPALDGSSGEVGQSSLESPAPFDFCCQQRGCQEGLRVFTHSLARSLTHSQLRSNAHTPIWHWERKALSLFNPHRSRGADSIWWVSEPCSVHLLHSSAPTYLPFISSLWLQLLFFLSFKSPRELLGPQFFSWMYRWTNGWMQGIQPDGPATWYYSSAGSQGSVLGLTARDVRGKAIGEGKGEVICTSLSLYSVKTKATTQWK